MDHPRARTHGPEIRTGGEVKSRMLNQQSQAESRRQNCVILCLCDIICFIIFLIFFKFFNLLMIVRERGRDTGRGRSKLHAPGAQRGIRSWVSRFAPWAKGRRQTAAPPRDPQKNIFKIIVLCVFITCHFLLLF